MHHGTDMKPHSAQVKYNIMAALVMDTIIMQNEKVGLVDFQQFK